MDFDWRKVVSTVAPDIATALGGPLAGLAVKAIGSAFGLGEGATEEADQQFAREMKALDVDLERIAAGDRNSAREREVKAGDSWTPRILALVITVGFFGVLGSLLVGGKPPTGGDALLVMLGSLATAWVGIVSYYFGSSAGSAAKTDLMAKAAAR